MTGEYIARMKRDYGTRPGCTMGSPAGEADPDFIELLKQDYEERHSKDWTEPFNGCTQESPCTTCKFYEWHSSVQFDTVTYRRVPYQKPIEYREVKRDIHSVGDAGFCTHPNGLIKKDEKKKKNRRRDPVVITSSSTQDEKKRLEINTLSGPPGVLIGEVCWDCKGEWPKNPPWKAPAPATTDTTKQRRLSP